MDGVRRSVHVRPRSSRPAVGGDHDGALVVAVAEPAEGGRANRAVVRALAAALGLPARSVRIAAGPTSRRKLVELDGDSAVLAARWEELRGGG